MNAIDSSTMIAGGVALIRLSNPPLNPLTRQTRLKLAVDLQNANENDGVSAIILVGSSRAFSVG
jgi:3-hydroxyacyl-CoA dehydrogenase